MVHIVQLRTKNGRLFGRAKNGSIWMHNHQAWTAKQLQGMQEQARKQAECRQIETGIDEYGGYDPYFEACPPLQRYVDIDRQHWTKVRGAA
jgi:hypothetical protein